MLSFLEEHEIVLSRVLTDRGTEYCGSDGPEYEFYLAVEDIDHTRTKAKSPQTDGIISVGQRHFLALVAAGLSCRG